MGFVPTTNPSYSHEKFVKFVHACIVIMASDYIPYSENQMHGQFKLHYWLGEILLKTK